MRTALIVPDSASNPNGGMGVQIAELMRVQRRSGIDRWVVYSTGEKPSDSETLCLRPLAEDTSEWGSASPLIRTSLNALSIYRQVLDGPRCDVVHAFDYSVYHPARHIASEWGVPLVVTENLSPWLMAKDGLYRHVPPAIVSRAVALEMEGLNYCDAIIQPSRGYTRRFPRVFDGKTVIVHNGIDVSDFRWIGRYRLPGINRTKIVYIGRFDLQKGVDLILQMQSDPEVDYVMIGNSDGGDPALFDWAKDRAAKEPNWFTTGKLLGQDKADALLQATAMLIPSRHEPFGIVGLEALASGTVPITTGVDGLSDFLTPENAFFIRPGVAALEDAVAKLKDESTRAKLVENGAGVARSFPWDRTHAAYSHLYQDVCRGFVPSEVEWRNESGVPAQKSPEEMFGV